MRLQPARLHAYAAIEPQAGDGFKDRWPQSVSNVPGASEWMAQQNGGSPRDANGDLRKHPDGGGEFIRRNLTPEASLAAICLLTHPKIGVLADITVHS